MIKASFKQGANAVHLNTKAKQPFGKAVKQQRHKITAKQCSGALYSWLAGLLPQLCRQEQAQEVVAYEPAVPGWFVLEKEYKQKSVRKCWWSVLKIHPRISWKGTDLFTSMGDACIANTE